jgi:hypothetical protein
MKSNIYNIISIRTFWGYRDASSAHHQRNILQGDAGRARGVDRVFKKKESSSQKMGKKLKINCDVR